MLKKIKSRLKRTGNRGSSFVLVIVSATFLSILISYSQSASMYHPDLLQLVSYAPPLTLFAFICFSNSSASYTLRTTLLPL